MAWCRGSKNIKVLGFLEKVVAADTTIGNSLGDSMISDVFGPILRGT